jgi:DNA-binding response OmpR family regulator
VKAAYPAAARPRLGGELIPPTGSIRLAVIDADSGFVRVLAKRLEGAGWQYRTLAAPVPLEELVAMRLNAIVVDLTVFGPRAWEFLERTSRDLPGLGIVVVTEQSTVAQRVRGLRLGADDWVNKPCHPEEVIARVEAVVRRRKRTSAPEDQRPVVAGELEIRADQFQAFVGGQTVDLTRREFELLQLLADAHGQVLQREEIYQRVWGYAMAHGDRSVDVFVRKLRQKLESVSPRWVYIHTHFGIGYRFQPEPKDGEAPAAVAAAAKDPERAGDGQTGAAEPAGRDEDADRPSPSLATPA